MQLLHQYGFMTMLCACRVQLLPLRFGGHIPYPLPVSPNVTRLSLGRRWVNLLPAVAQRTNALTNGVVDRPWVVGREFESHVHHESAF